MLTAYHRTLFCLFILCLTTQVAGDPPREPSKPPTKPAPPVQQSMGQDLFQEDTGLANPIETAEQKIRSALLRQVDLEFQGISFRAVIDEFSSATSAPIRLSVKKLEPLMVSEDTPINMTLPRMTLHSALGNILSSLSDELTFTIRDEVLLITTKEDAAQDQPIKLQTTSPANADSGDAFIKYWLKISETPSAAKADQTALRKALQEHLEKEFDTKQEARRAELDRLRTLLKQSEDWLSTRQSRRAEIVGKKVDELLEKARMAPAAGR